MRGGVGCDSGAAGAAQWLLRGGAEGLGRSLGDARVDQVGGGRQAAGGRGSRVRVGSQENVTAEEFLSGGLKWMRT